MNHVVVPLNGLATAKTGRPLFFVGNVFVSTVWRWISSWNHSSRYSFTFWQNVMVDGCMGVKTLSRGQRLRSRQRRSSDALNTFYLYFRVHDDFPFVRLLTLPINLLRRRIAKPQVHLHVWERRRSRTVSCPYFFGFFTRDVRVIASQTETETVHFPLKFSWSLIILCADTAIRLTLPTANKTCLRGRIDKGHLKLELCHLMLFIARISEFISIEFLGYDKRQKKSQISELCSISLYSCTFVLYVLLNVGLTCSMLILSSWRNRILIY